MHESTAQRSAGAAGRGGPGEPGSAAEKTSVKETVTSIVIAFILAFVFRGFVIEAFLIPTGSMAPTLMGAHMRFTGPSTGYTWPVGPQYFQQGREMGTAPPLAVQGGPAQPVVVHDPMTREELHYTTGVPIRTGDRIFVLKYLYALLGPERFDVIVFKNPTNPQENFIKRLVGLPGEHVALIDGDVFSRPAASGEAAPATPEINAWTTDGWRIARKPERVQRAVWQTVFDTRYTPARPMRDSDFSPPWLGGEGWQIAGRSVYRYEGAGPTELVWDGARRPIVDECPYNEPPRAASRMEHFPVSDVRVALDLEMDKAGGGVAVHLDANGRQFRAVLAGESGRVSLEMRAMPVEGQEPEAWSSLAEGEIGAVLKAGQPASVEFWHADQALTLWVNGRQVAHGEYDWSPSQRVQAAMGETLESLLAEADRAPGGGRQGNPLIWFNRYRQPAVRLEFSGGAFTVHRLVLDRDLFYRPGILHESGLPARATHPYATVTLTPDQFFVCGDNSPLSMDARLWEHVDPWVEATITDAAVGVVPRELLVGKAFFVYFPSLQRSLGLPMPDFGRMRFIW